MWILTTSINEYHQLGGYFMCGWSSKPTVKQIEQVTGESNDVANHILSGGGRRGIEDQWWNLREYVDGEPAELE